MIMMEVPLREEVALGYYSVMRALLTQTLPGHLLVHWNGHPKEVPEVYLNGSGGKRLPQTLVNMYSRGPVKLGLRYLKLKAIRSMSAKHDSRSHLHNDMYD